MIRAKHDQGSRRIQVTGLPTEIHIGRQEISRLPTELSIVINYTSDDPHLTLDKAICLDHVVIPAIVEALNRSRTKSLV